MRACFDFCVEAFNFVFEIVSDGIHGDADGKIRRASKRFSGPVRALIQTVEDFDEADGINFVDAARFGDSRRQTAGRP